MPDLSAVRCISFDCYGTLVDWETGILTALKPLFQIRNLEFIPKEILEIYSSVEPEIQAKNWKPYKEILKEVVRHIGAHFHFKPNVNELGVLATSLPFWPAWPESADMLSKFRKRYTVAVFSNVDNDLLQATFKNHRFNVDLTSTAEDNLCYKPHQMFFTKALQKTGFRPEEIIHVSCSMFHDVIPATAMGIKTILIQRKSEMFSETSKELKGSTEVLLSLTELNQYLLLDI